jgi:hypothetical protein
MKKYATLAALTLVFLMSGATTSHAEIKEVQMKIGGYLCGM